MKSITTRNLLTRAPLAALVLALACIETRAADRTWNNAAGGNFNDNANWSDTTAPANTDIAVFNLAGTYTVTFPAHEVTNQLRIDGADPTFNLAGKIYSNNGIPFVSSSLIQVGVTANSGLTLTSSPTGGVLLADSLQIGSEIADGTLTVNGGAKLDIAGGINVGDFAVGPGVGTLVINGGTVETVDIEISSMFGALTFDGGTLEVSGSLSTFSATAQNVGNGAGDAAVMNLTGGSNISGGLNVDSDATVNLSGGFHSIGGTGIDLAGGGDLNLLDGFLFVSSITGGTIGWTSGSISYGTDLTIETGGRLGASVTLSDKSLQLNGTNAALTIDATGTLIVDKTSLGSLSAKSITNSGGTFKFNKGSITITDGDLTIGANDLIAVSGGGTNVTLNDGDVLSVAKSTMDGTTTIDSGYTLTIDGGTFTTDNLTVNGKVRYVDGTITTGSQALVIGSGSGGGNIDAPQASTTLNLNDSGSAGDSIITDSSVTIDSGYTVNVSGGFLQSGFGDLTNNGTLTITDDGGVFASGSTVNNSILTLNGGSLSTNTITNTGTFTFESGTLSVLSGDLEIGDNGINAPAPVDIDANSNITVNGTTSVVTGRTLRMNGGTLFTRAFDNESGGGTFEFFGGVVQINDDNLEVGPNGINAPNPTVTLNSGDFLTVSDNAFTLEAGGTTSVASDRELVISGGQLQTNDLTVAGKATFNSGSLRVLGEDINVHVVDPTPGSGGISHSSGIVTIGSTSQIWVDQGSVTVDDGQGLTLNGGSLRTKSIQEDAIDSFSYVHGELFLHESDLVIGPGAVLNDKRLLGANPVLISGVNVFDNVVIDDTNPDNFFGPVLGNTTIESGGSLTINGGDFYTAGDLTVENGASLSGEDRNISFVKAGLGGTVGVVGFSETTLFTNHGEVSPRDNISLSGGALEYNGDYLQSSTGELHLELHAMGSGTSRFSSSDQLLIGGEATLDGMLILTFDTSYAWTAGDVFNLIVAGQGFNSMYDLMNISYPDLPPGLSLVFDYTANNGNSLRLSVIPEPASWVLMMLSLFGVIALRRRVITSL